MMGLAIVQVPGLRTSYPVPAKIVGIEMRKPWWNFFRETPRYKIEIVTSNIEEKFLNQFGKAISAPNSFLFNDTQKVLSEKKTGDTLDVTLDYADEDQQYFQRVHPFHFTIERKSVVR